MSQPKSIPRGEAPQHLKGRVPFLLREAGLEKAFHSREMSVRDLALQVWGQFLEAFYKHVSARSRETWEAFLLLGLCFWFLRKAP